MAVPPTGIVPEPGHWITTLKSPLDNRHVVANLEESGLVHTEKVGRVRTCRLEATGFSVLEQWIRDRRSTWERRLDRLGELLAEPDAPD